jgi:N-hydroxyarylamine O-acetyltransferase
MNGNTPHRSPLVAPFPYLEAYFDRIGYTGPVRPEPDVLRCLHELHPRHIPFENLTPFCHEPVPLDSEQLYRKLIATRRGGYCFEHNLLFAGVLTAIGFRVSGLSARVHLGAAPEANPPRSHMLLLVETDRGRWLADVGFGGLTLTAPLEFSVRAAQKTPHEEFMVSDYEGRYFISAQVAGEWRRLYSFDLQVQQQCDYEIVNWYLSNHPASRFTTGLMLARAAADGRHAMRDLRYSFHPVGAGASVITTMQSPEQLLSVLDEAFGIDVAALTDLPERVTRLMDDVIPSKT